MKNELFDNTAMELILSPETWHFVSSLFEEEVDFVPNPTHFKWMRTHRDCHPAREILFALKGHGIYGFKDKIYPCPPGTIFLFNSYESHDPFYPTSSPEMDHLWLTVFEHNVVAKLLHIWDGKIKTVGPSPIFIEAPAARLLIDTWDELEGTSALPPTFRRAKLITALSPILLRIAECGFKKPEGHIEPHFQKQVIETIRYHVAKTAGRDVPLTEAARLAGYSKFHFLRLFRQETGQTFHEFVDGCRLKKVAAMIQERRTKTEISETLGFSHLSTFLRWMKAQEQKMKLGAKLPDHMLSIREGEAVKAKDVDRSAGLP